MRIKVTPYYEDTKNRQYDMEGYAVEKEISGTPGSIGNSILQARSKFRAGGHTFQCMFKVELTDD